MYSIFHRFGFYRWLALFVAGFCALSSLPAVQADSPAVLIKDINPTNASFSFNYGPVPSRLISVGNRVFFVGADPNNGYELWTSDGTPAGTRLVRDIAAGPDSAFLNDMAALNGKLYFLASDYHTGIQIWFSDGTASGTAPLIPPSVIGPYNPASLTSASTTLYFVAFNAQAKPGLWKSDGTAGITQVDPTGWALFAASDGIGGVELWRTQGTPQNTLLVQDLALGASSSLPEAFTVSGAQVFFAADDGLTGAELWKVDRATVTAPPLHKTYLPFVRR
jgi:ELWxxDGT repeat protein